MGSITNYTENNILNHFFGKELFVPLTNMYLALFVDDPTEEGLTVSEPSLFGYARTEIVFGTAANRTIAQSGAITFPQCDGGGWGTLQHWGIMDAETGGNMIAYGELETPLVTFNSYITYIKDGAVQISMLPGTVSDAVANLGLTALFNGIPIPFFDLYIAFCYESPEDSDDGSTIPELVGGNYSRVKFANWSYATEGITLNETSIEFPLPSEDWRNITHTALCDAVIGGNMVFYGISNPNQAPTKGKPVRYNKNNFITTIN